MQDCFMDTYHRLPVSFTKGEGVYLFDEQGKKYLDFSAGIAVNCLGHRHPAIMAALKKQSEKILHVCNYYNCDTSILFAQKLTAACKMKNVFLCNSGAEANEGAIKIARKYSFKKYGAGRHTIVTLNGSFHGRTITTLSATGQDCFHKDFGPFTEGFRFVTRGNSAELDAALDNTVCALIIEAVQGESGVNIQEKAFIKAAAELCAERDILLIFDEVQCGMGRTGMFLGYEHFDVKPDIVTLAKALGGGIPCGAFLAGEKACNVLESGDHGSTFGGNPLAAACGIAVLDTVNTKEFLAGITELGKFFTDKLKALKNPKITGIRNLGLMIACDITIPSRSVLEKALANGLLLLSAGEKTLRFLPPYIISKANIEEALNILDKTLNEL
ncbi:MAG: aspartate aminotransferase family protein [Spirochaetaceae bacterium]|jgi:acetylornithine/N-succinyldiaminopimelate aminotransferase|nr:aspartate aminotransferase family protein [Spirochaetaceae bacterium]